MMNDFEGKKKAKIPFFSVVIPIYKTESYWAQCLESILTQSCHDFEIIAVDDGSDGNALQIIESFRDGRIKYIRHEKNYGTLQARLTGLKASCGRYIVPVDADDYLNPGLFAKLHALITETPDADCVCFQMTVKNKNQEWDFAPLFDQKIYDPKRFFSEIHEKKFIFWNLCGKAVRRELYAAVIRKLEIPEKFHITSGEDALQIFPVLASSSRIVATPFFGYCYVMHEKSVSHDLFSPGKWQQQINSFAISFSLQQHFFEKYMPEPRHAIIHLVLEDMQKECCRELFLRAASLPARQRLECADYLYAHFNKQYVWDAVCQELERQKQTYEHSCSWRIARLLTFPLRILQKMICRAKIHGFRYMLKRIFSKGENFL